MRLKISFVFSFIAFIISSFFIPLDIFPQVTEEWVARYNGPGNSADSAKAIAIDSSGNVYVTGDSWGYGYGSGPYWDYATVKYNSAGIQQWIARYNGPGSKHDWANAIAIDSSRNVYVTGYSYGSGTHYDYATVKYNNAGVQQWVSRYNAPENRNDCASALAIDSSGNVYVTGYSYGSGTTVYDIVTIKYNNEGVQKWVARYNGPGNTWDYAEAIAVDNLGNVYVTGYIYALDFVTIKYNSLGVQQWVAIYNGPGNAEDRASDIAIDSSGNVYVTGASNVSGIYWDYATIKYNSLGVQQWVARYNVSGNGSDYAEAIAIDSSGNVYVTGGSCVSGASWDYATIKYNNAGVQQWVTRYNGPGNYDDKAEAIAIDSSGNVYVTGASNVSGIYSSDYATIKYNSAGVEQWVAKYNGQETDWNYAYAISIDISGNVYVTGESSGYTTIKYSQGSFSDAFYLY